MQCLLDKKCKTKGCAKGGLLGCHVDSAYVHPSPPCGKATKAKSCYKLAGCIIDGNKKCIDPRQLDVSAQEQKDAANKFCGKLKKCHASKTCILWNGECYATMGMPDDAREKMLSVQCAKAKKCKGQCYKNPENNQCTHLSLLSLSEHAKYCKGVTKCKGHNGVCKYVKKKGCQVQEKQTIEQYCAKGGKKCKLDGCIPKSKKCIPGDRCTIIKKSKDCVKKPYCTYTKAKKCHHPHLTE